MNTTNLTPDDAKSLGGDYPVTRRCAGQMHYACLGHWTQYPDQSGPCECDCHLGGAGDDRFTNHHSADYSVNHG